MKKLIPIALLFISVNLSAQFYNIAENKLSQFFFDERIESFYTSLEPAYISLQKDNNVLLVQLMTLETNEFNIVVKTIDGLYYSLTIQPKQDPETLTYFVPKNIATNFVKTNTANSTIGGANNTSYNSRNNVFSKILDKKGFMRTANVVHNQKIYLYIKGIYVDQENIYFRLELHNKTNINYQVAKVNFYISERESSVMTSTDNAPVEPIESYQEPEKILGKDTKEFIYSFKKFTIDRDKKFTINIVESNGDRILNLNIYTDQFADAKSINF